MRPGELRQVENTRRKGWESVERSTWFELGRINREGVSEGCPEADS